MLRPRWALAAFCASVAFGAPDSGATPAHQAAKDPSKGEAQNVVNALKLIKKALDGAQTHHGPDFLAHLATAISTVTETAERVTVSMDTCLSDNARLMTAAAQPETETAAMRLDDSVKSVTRAEEMSNPAAKASEDHTVVAVATEPPHELPYQSNSMLGRWLTHKPARRSRTPEDVDPMVKAYDQPEPVEVAQTEAKLAEQILTTPPEKIGQVMEEKATADAVVDPSPEQALEEPGKPAEAHVAPYKPHAEVHLTNAAKALDGVKAHEVAAATAAAESVHVEKKEVKEEKAGLEPMPSNPFPGAKSATGYWSHLMAAANSVGTKSVPPPPPAKLPEKAPVDVFSKEFEQAMKEKEAQRVKLEAKLVKADTKWKKAEEKAKANPFKLTQALRAAEGALSNLEATSLR